MPELPEVETVVRGLRPCLEGKRLVRVDQHRPDLRFPLPKDFVAQLEGQRILALKRRAKYILAGLESGQVLYFHLGMSGRVTIFNATRKRGGQKHAGEEVPPLGKHDHVVFHTDEGCEIRYCDPRRFGMMDIAENQLMLESHKTFARLGPEPLGNAFGPTLLYDHLQKRKSAIKLALLDQRVVAGLGNIYVCEALHQAGIMPTRRSRDLTTQECESLTAAIRETLHKAITAGGSSLRDYAQVSGELGYFQHQWRVYSREGDLCLACSAGVTIERIEQSGRSSFYCPVCQS